MSKGHGTPVAIVEWAPTHVSWVDGSHRLVSAASLEEAASQLPSRDVIVAISRRSAFIRVSRVPNASRADVHRILQVQIGQLFPIPAGETSFDFHLTHDVNSEGRLAVMTAMRSSDLQSLHAQAKAAGLRVTRVVPAAMASPLLARSLQLDNAAVVHRTAEGLAIDLVAGGELRYSRIAASPSNALGIDAEVSRTFAAAVTSCSPTIAAGALALPDAEASTDLWAIESLAGAHLDINLETPDQVAAHERGKENRRLQLSLLVFGAGAVFLCWQYLRYSDAALRVANVQASSANSLSQRKLLRDGETVKASNSGKLKATLDRGFSPAQPVSDVLMRATNLTPQGVWLNGLSLERGQPLTIRGTATSGAAVAAYQDALINDQDSAIPPTRRFRDVKLLFANNTDIETTPVVQFSISAFPVGNLPLLDAAAQKGAPQP